mmetsp:Transcript_2418/g.3598  ORF Transcript_2418/g.3598 Transcript_2418/m.3598 type:complete len:139 (+) Transcript_2418:543-959(+)
MRTLLKPAPNTALSNSSSSIVVCVRWVSLFEEPIAVMLALLNGAAYATDTRQKSGSSFWSWTTKARETPSRAIFLQSHNANKMSLSNHRPPARTTKVLLLISNANLQYHKYPSRATRNTNRPSQQSTNHDWKSHYRCS